MSNTPVAAASPSTRANSARNATRTRSDPVADAVKDIRDKLKDGGLFEDDLTNGELKAIAGTFQQLTGRQSNAVLAELSDAEINKITDEIDSNSLGNYNGLSLGEKKDLLADLAGKVDATQFQRVAHAFDDPQVTADVLTVHGTHDSKIGFINAFKDQASSNATSVGLIDSIAGVQRHGNESARAIGTVLGSLDAVGLERAIGTTDPTTGDFRPGALSTEQLRTVIDASLGKTSHTDGPAARVSSLPSYSFDARRVNQILDAAVRSGDAGLKAEVFQATSQALEQVQGVGGFLIPSVDSHREAAAISQHLGGLLRSDPVGIVDRLETVDPTGKALIPFTRQQLADGRTQDLNDLLGALRNGPAGNSQAWLSNRGNAQNLGYVLGSINSGLKSLEASNKQEAELLKGLLGIPIGRIPVAGDVLSLASGQLIDSTLGEVGKGAKKAPAALYELTVQGLSDRAQGWIDGAMSRVNSLN